MFNAYNADSPDSYLDNRVVKYDSTDCKETKKKRRKNFI